MNPFIQRWHNSAAAERANYQLFLSELCDYLDVPRPNPAVGDNRQDQYVFERQVTFRHPNGLSSTGFIDLYKRGCFVLEAKQGSPVPEKTLLFETPARRRGAGVRGTSGWDEAMLRARNQAEQYAKALPVEDGWPPFLITVDVGYSIELFADFSNTGKAYVPFPDSLLYRILLEDLDRQSNRERLRNIWLDPLSLDPSRISAKVTRDVAWQLANLARDLEKEKHPPEAVASFLMRCIFTFFAEDIRLLPHESFSNLLDTLAEDLQNFKPMVESLWQTMNTGGFSPILREHVLRFNGGLFESVEALPLNRRQFDLLRMAAAAEWKDVEPAIFGTLLERALDERERHSLGAHYTPRAYVERLVVPTVIEPLRQDWRDVQTAAVSLDRSGRDRDAIEVVSEFRRKLCSVEVLDPACGSGNFLYVTLEHLKRLEGEVNDALESLGETQQALHETGLTVDPHQLKGIELNPRAAAITDLVLWIGYLQWYFRTWGASSTPPQPVIKRFHNIEHRDALLAYDAVVPERDEDGNPVTRWDGITKKTNPITGEEVPDESARRTVMRYTNARRAEWPDAQFIVGNPPFLGNWRMRGELDSGYAETLRAVYSEVPETAEHVMYWWHRAAELVRSGKVRRFGFITTKSLRQTFQRRVVTPHLTDPKTPCSLVFAIPNHPWVDSYEGAQVRIAMTVAEAGIRDGLLMRVTSEEPGEEEGAARVEFIERRGLIHPDLTIGPNTATAVPLRANERLSCPGVKLHGAGFIVSPEKAGDLGLGRISGLDQHIRQYRNGRDITSHPRGAMVIDLFGLSAGEVRALFPEVYQWVFDHVKPERDQNNRSTYRDNWWIHGEPRANFRPALKGLRRYIATVETSKHRFFVFLDASILPDNKLANIASSDAFVLGVLSSRIHVTWALAAGGRLGFGDDPVYVKTHCFEPFPFPDASEPQRERIRFLAEQLDAHRKRRQELYPRLTLTEIYNVLAEVRAGEPLGATSQLTHDQGLVSVLRDIHDDIDRAVTEAYGWPVDPTEEEILFRLVDLNAARAAEERAGLVRWLRPEFQKIAATQIGLEVEMEEEEAQPARATRFPWPASLPERVRAVRDYLLGSAAPAQPETVARAFTRARVPEVTAILETLAALGQANLADGGYRA
jgi:hypothetical protein